MAKYSCLQNTFWQDEKIRQLDDSGKLLFLAFMSSRSTNMIGLYSYPYGYAMHDLNGWDDVKFRLYEGQLAKLGIAHYDYSAEVVLVQNYLKYNRLVSVKAIEAGYKHLRDVPTSYLLTKFASIWDLYIYDPYRAAYEQRVAACKDSRLRAQHEASYAQVLKMTEAVRSLVSEVQKLFNDISDTVSIPYPETKSDEVRLTKDTLSKSGLLVQDTLSRVARYPIDTLSLHITEAEADSRNQKQKQKQKQKHEPFVPAEAVPDTVSDLLDSIRALWSEILVPVGLPEIVQFTEARRAILLSRIDEDPQRSSLEWWSDLFYRIAYRTFFPRLIAEHTGQWVTFDWLMAEENFIPLLEGKYDGDRKKASSPETIAMKSPSTILRERFEEAPKGYIDIADIDATTTESEVHGNDE